MKSPNFTGLDKNPNTIRFNKHNPDGKSSSKHEKSENWETRTKIRSLQETLGDDGAEIKERRIGWNRLIGSINKELESPCLSWCVPPIIWSRDHTKKQKFLSFKVKKCRQRLVHKEDDDNNPQKCKVHFLCPRHRSHVPTSYLARLDEEDKFNNLGQKESFVIFKKKLQTSPPITIRLHD